MVIGLVALAYFGALAYICGKLVDKGEPEAVMIVCIFAFMFGIPLLLGLSGVVTMENLR